MGNPELNPIEKKHSKAYLRGLEDAKDFYGKYFDNESVPRKVLKRFDDEKATFLALLKDGIDRAGDKNPKKKSYLLNQKKFIEGRSLTLRKQIKKIIAETKQSFLHNGALSYDITDEHSIRTFFGKNGNKIEAKSEAGEIQREFDTAVKHLVSKYLKEMKKLRY